ncbi:MAG: hypothetical protein IKA11_00735 [Clostridia bacterium]|nr:hypothetical protein [Clostridia bacterium]
MKKTAEEILVTLIDLFTYYLDEINDIKTSFVHGEKTAYVECLQIIQGWEFAERYGLIGEIEDKYKI